MKDKIKMARKNLLDLLNVEEIKFLNNLSYRFEAKYKPDDPSTEYAKTKIVLDYQKVLSDCQRIPLPTFPLLSDSGTLYLLGTIYRFINFGVNKDETYRLMQEECPEFIRIFEKIYSSINRDITNIVTKTGQQHFGNIIGPFGTINEAEGWLEKSKKELKEFGTILKNDDHVYTFQLRYSHLPSMDVTLKGL